MRALFLVVAASVAALIAVLLLGPRLVDGEAVRERVLARLEAATGAPARVLGPTAFALLPEPRLSLSDLVVGDPRGGGATVEVERVDLVLGLAGLVGAEGGFEAVRLVRPRIRASELPGAGLLASALDALAHGRLPVGAVSIVDGRAILRDPRLSEPIELVELDLEAARETGGGPLAVSGGGRWRDRRVAVELELRPASVGPASVRLQLGLGAGAAASRLAYRGALAVEDRALRLDGELELAADSGRTARLLETLGQTALAAGIPPIGPFAARGRLRLDAARAELSELRIATAAGELAGVLGLGLGDAPELALELEAGRLELPGGPWPRGLAGLLWGDRLPGLGGRIALRIGSLIRGGEELRLVHLDARLGREGALELERLTAELPGIGDLELAARLAQEPGGPTWRGRLALRTEDPGPLFRWLGVEPPVPADRLGGIGLEGTLHATPEGASLGEAEIRLAGSHGRGTLSLLFGPPPRLLLRGTLDRLALDPWLERVDLRAWLVHGPPATFEAELDLAIDRLARAGVRADRVRLRGELTEGRLRLAELSSADLGGARASLAGSLGPGEAADLALELEAPDPVRFARALETDLGPLALLEGPLTGRARLANEGGGRALEALLELPGARLRLAGAFAAGSLEPERTSLELELADSASVATRLGVLGPLGPGLAGRLMASGRAARTGSGWRIEGNLAAGRIGGRTELELRTDAPVPALRGKVELERLDPPSVAELYRLLEPILGLPRGPLRGWPGAWPRQLFGTPRLPPADLELALAVGFVSAEGTPFGRGTATLSLAGSALALDGIDLPLAQGRLGGRLLAELKPGTAHLEAELTLASASLATLAEALRAGAPAGGIVDLEASLASEGRSLGELLANAGGRGAVILRELPADGLAPVAADGSSALLRGAFTLERGLLRAPELVVEGTAGPGTAALAFDLAAWILDLELRGEAGGLRLFGPPDRLRRYELAAR